MYSIILIIVNLIFRVCAAGIVANPLILPPIILDPDLTLDGAPKREGFTVVTKAWLKKSNYYYYNKKNRSNYYFDHT